MGATPDTLRARAAILRAVRAHFEREGFVEVETPARVRAPGQEVHLDAIPSGDRWLVTSPEYHMKRLLAAGHERIFQIGKAWRGGESGPHHLPEFTIVEWYRAGAPLDAIARDCEAILADAMGRAVAAERTTVRDLLSHHAGIDLRGDETPSDLLAGARSAGVRVADGAAWDDVFFQIWLDRVESHVGRPGPTFVFDWPVPLGALARRKAGDPRLVERFEVYLGGLELANAFGELSDPAEQRARFDEESRIRAARGKPTFPIDEKLLAVLSGIAGASGAALGFDRLVMLALGQGDIRDVVAFAGDEI